MTRFARASTALLVAAAGLTLAGLASAWVSRGAATST